MVIEVSLEKTAHKVLEEILEREALTQRELKVTVELMEKTVFKVQPVLMDCPEIRVREL